LIFLAPLTLGIAWWFEFDPNDGIPLRIGWGMGIGSYVFTLMLFVYKWKKPLLTWVRACGCCCPETKGNTKYDAPPGETTGLLYGDSTVTLHSD
jgi:hypothetical protein